LPYDDADRILMHFSALALTLRRCPPRIWWSPAMRRRAYRWFSRPGWSRLARREGY